jgi:DNA-binding PadR family transcriptional regulator
METNDDPRAQLPLTESTYFILLSLAPGPRHGYAVMKDVQSLSQERVVLSTGTLYSALKRLLDQGWIIRVDDPHNGSDGRVRKAYQLTSIGQRILQAEVERLAGLVGAAQLRSVGDIS